MFSQMTSSQTSEVLRLFGLNGRTSEGLRGFIVQCGRCRKYRPIGTTPTEVFHSLRWAEDHRSECGGGSCCSSDFPLMFDND